MSVSKCMWVSVQLTPLTKRQVFSEILNNGIASFLLCFVFSFLHVFLFSSSSLSSLHPSFPSSLPSFYPLSFLPLSLKLLCGLNKSGVFGGMEQWYRSWDETQIEWKAFGRKSIRDYTYVIRVYEKHIWQEHRVVSQSLNRKSKGLRKRKKVLRKHPDWLLEPT